MCSSDLPAPAPAPTSTSYPLSGSSYIGPLSGSDDSLSGSAPNGSDAWLRPSIQQVQQRLIDTGYARFFAQYGADGYYGNDVASSELGQATLQFQRDHPPLSVDGGIGRETWDAIFGAPQSAPARPAGPGFPLSGGQYFGPLTGPSNSLSGMAPDGSDVQWRDAIRQAQQRLIDIGYGRFFVQYGADGMYGTDVASSELGQATLQFQRDHPPLSVDGGIGRETWDAFFA